MSRGWESKSVEEQQALAASPKRAVASTSVEDASQKRHLRDLQLQRERILSERTASPYRRTALASALVDIEEKLTELGWTVHL